jgi:hypothetical protein
MGPHGRQGRVQPPRGERGHFVEGARGHHGLEAPVDPLPERLAVDGEEHRREIEA